MRTLLTRPGILATAALLACASGHALADPLDVQSRANTASGWVSAGEVSMNVGIGNEWFNDIPLSWTASTDPVTGATVYALDAPVVLTTSDNSTLTIGSASFDPDPVLLFSASAVNNGDTPLAYSFAFNTPLNPALNGAVNSHAELGLTLTDGLNDGAAVRPLTGQGFMLKSYDLYGNADSVSKNVDIGTAYTIFSGTSGTNYSADGTLTCNQACVTMSAQLNFVLTAHDSVGISGKVLQTTAVPLPAGIGLLGSGLLSLLGLRRRRGARQPG